MISFFDANCIVGRRCAPLAGAMSSPCELIEEMHRLGLDGALATHATAVELDMPGGNARMSEICARHSEFQACYVIAPHHVGDIPRKDALVRHLEDGRARAVRMYPKRHRYGAGELCCGETYSTLAEAGIPLFVDFNQITAEEIDGVMTAHPSLHLAIVRMVYLTARWLYPLFAKHPNLRIETEVYLEHRGIAQVCAKFGSDRLIYGSGMPVYSAGAAMALILYAEVSEADKRKMASENLLRILWKASS